MVEDCTIVAVGETRFKGWASQDRQPGSFGRYPLDSANWSALARLAQEIPQSIDLLASIESLGRTRHLAKNLANIPFPAGRRRPPGLGRSLY
jgi:hypothetical protein